MEFERRKAAVLAALSSAEYSDKSPKGSLDSAIVPLIGTINGHPSLYTTSSCSGRISILFQPHSAAAVSKKKARGGSWLFISHDPAVPEAVVDALFNAKGASHQFGDGGGDIVFRFEPFIVAVECQNVESAQFLVSTAIACGFRESGITNTHKRIMAAIRSSIRLEVPLGEMGHIMVSPKYVRYLVEVANAKMVANRERTDRFYQILQSKALDISSENAASKENLASTVSSKQQCDKAAGHDDICTSTSYFSEEDKGTSSSCKSPAGDVNGYFEPDVGFLYSNTDNKDGLVGEKNCALRAALMTVIGEPVERLFLWGHSACVVNERYHKAILLFGGFGGIGRHARRNDLLMLDPNSGTLKAIHAEILPSQRLGQTSSTVGEDVYLIGGRGDPAQIFNDVWVLHTTTYKLELLHCAGSVFHPRHRHAAEVVGRKIYVFGGLNGDTIFSCLHVLDTDTLEWTELCTQGKDWPCARHSHSMVAKGSQLFVFGGYDGERALGGLYSFDTLSSTWKKEKTTGQGPFARFSHSMFVYNDYIGIVGGCPIAQNFQELALLDLRNHVWKHVSVYSINKDLFVRATASVIGDELVILGGGASCYAFGTKFNEPMKISLRPLLSSNTILFEVEEEAHAKSEDDKNSVNPFSGKPLVLQLEKKYGKFGKDILKKLGWLDLGRKVYPSKDGLCICLPVTEGCYPLFQEKTFPSRNMDITNKLHGRGVLMSDMPIPVALDLLQACGGSVVLDDKICIKQAPKSPRKVLREAVSSLLKNHGIPLQLLDELPKRWEKLGDMIVLPITSFSDPVWRSIGDQLWPIVADALGTHLLARQGRIVSNGTRDSTLEILVGDSGWVSHHENGICYSFDATKCMFSFGNFSEKLRMGCLDCRGEVVVDLFAGIGYFVLPFLVKAKAKLVYACEWNPHAIEALQRNLQANSVEDRCFILEGDNRLTAPKRVADRVCLGLLPSSESSWLTAVKALRSEGGTLHVHGNVNDSEEVSWSEYVAKTISSFATSEGYRWDVSIQHVERVKWYGPHIRHLVADVRCKQRLT